MSTSALAADPAAPVASPDARPVVLVVPRARVYGSRLNPRKHFDPVTLRELAASMGHGVGIMSPLIVRPMGADTGDAAAVMYEVVAGERRLRAAEIAGIDDIPVIVKTLTDVQVLELMLIENEQREGISPLEEAETFKSLLGFAFTIDDIALKIGRPRRHVWERLKLLELVPEAQALLARGVITAGHANVLARCAPELQRRAVDLDAAAHDALFEREATLLTVAEQDVVDLAVEFDPYRELKTRTVRELEAWVAQHERLALTSETTAELFPETVRQAAAAPKVVHLTYGYQVHPDVKTPGAPRIYSGRSWQRADGHEGSTPCDHRVLGVIVEGAGYGQAFEVCLNKDGCSVHWAREQKQKRQQAKARAAEGADVEAQRRERRRADAALRIKRAAATQAQRVALGKIVASGRDLSSKPVWLTLLERLGRDGDVDWEGFTAQFGFTTSHGLYRRELAALAKRPAPELLRMAVWCAVSAAARDWNGWTPAEVFKAFKIDLATLEAAALPAAQRGTCLYCGCTETNACTPPCSWTDETQTVCSAPACVADAAKAARKTAAKKPAKVKVKTKARARR